MQKCVKKIRIKLNQKKKFFSCKYVLNKLKIKILV